jgi:hypothetical protein
MTAEAEREQNRRKTRSLRKYEAEPVAQIEDSDAPRLEFFSPFGPMIARTEISPVLVDRINNYADRQLHPGQGTELLLPPAVVLDGGAESLRRQTERLIARYMRRLEGAARITIRIDAFWIVSQYAGTPSPVHFHSGDMSGVMYLKVPAIEQEEQEREKTYISGRWAGCINFLIGGRQRLSRSLVSFEPRVGDFYLFPGWLLHGAEPFRGTGERRSLAFNAYVETVEE